MVAYVKVNRTVGLIINRCKITDETRYTKRV